MLIALLVLRIPEGHQHPTETLTIEDTSSRLLNQKSKPGPWGDLTFIRILTEPPEDHFNIRYQKGEHFDWILKDYDEAQLANLWEQAELSSAERTILNQAALRQDPGNVLKIAAPREFVRKLSNQARTAIYAALSKFPENKAQNEPYRFTADRRDEWFKDSGLKPESVSLISSFFYQRGNSVLFSDKNLVMSELGSAEQRLLFLRALTRTSTMLVKLEIKPDTDIDALADYWGQGTRSKNIKSLLQSLQRKRSAVSIDIIHLLPPFARSLLYTYPASDDPGSRTYKDCHWTSLNFFKLSPDPRYEDINVIVGEITQDYHPISGPSRFGDLILFADVNAQVIHSCIYIADDIVFTKNGVNPSTPWILMSLDDVIATYPANQTLDVQRYRRKATGL